VEVAALREDTNQLPDSVPSTRCEDLRRRISLGQISLRRLNKIEQRKTLFAPKQALLEMY
jgi:hypothetical protein